MLTLKQIQNRLQTSNIAAIEKRSGVTRKAIEYIKENGEEGNPEYKNYKKLSDYFEEQER